MNAKRCDTLAPMARILLAADSKSVRDEVRSVLADGETSFIEIDRGNNVVEIAKKQPLDLAILDMQMASMGGIATCLELRLEESGGRLEHIPVLLLLDRRPDVFLARRSGAEGWLIKPLNSVRIKNCVKTLLNGGEYHDDSYIPDPVLVD